MPLLAGAGPSGGEVSAIKIGGRIGWLHHRHDEDGDWYAIVWQATPGRVIAVSGHAPLARVMTVAESLRIVGEAEWRAALPNATSTFP